MLEIKLNISSFVFEFGRERTIGSQTTLRKYDIIYGENRPAADAISIT